MSTFDFGSWGITPSNLLAGSPAAISDNIDRLYMNAVGRRADSEGKQYWKDKIASGENTYQTLMGALMGSKEFAGRSDAKKANPNVTEAQLDAMNFEGNWDYHNPDLFATPGSALNTYAQAGGGRITPLVAAELVADAATSSNDVTIGDNVVSGSRDVKQLTGGIYGGPSVPTITPEVEEKKGSTLAELQSKYPYGKGKEYDKYYEKFRETIENTDSPLEVVMRFYSSTATPQDFINAFGRTKSDIINSKGSPVYEGETIIEEGEKSEETPDKIFGDFKSNLSKEEAEAIYGPGIDEVYNYVFGVDTGMSGAGKEHYLKDLVENRAGLTQGQNWKLWLDKAFRNTEDYKFKAAGEQPERIPFDDDDEIELVPGIGGDGAGGTDFAKLFSDALKDWGLDDRFSSLSGDISTLQGDYKTLSNDYNTLSNDLTTGLSDLGIDFTKGLTDLGTDLTNLGGTYSDNIRDLKKEFSDTRDSNAELLKGFQDSNSRVLQSYQKSIASFQEAQNAQAAYGERTRNPTVKGVRTQNELPGFKPRTSGTGFFGRGSNRLTTSSLNI